MVALTVAEKGSQRVRHINYARLRGEMVVVMVAKVPRVS